MGQVPPVGRCMPPPPAAQWLRQAWRSPGPALYIEDASTTGTVTVRRNFRSLRDPNIRRRIRVQQEWSADTEFALYDASGALIGRSATVSTGARMIWSRVETRAVAPKTARLASIEVYTAVHPCLKRGGTGSM